MEDDEQLTVEIRAKSAYIPIGSAYIILVEKLKVEQTFCSLGAKTVVLKPAPEKSRVFIGNFKQMRSRF